MENTVVNGALRAQREEVAVTKLIRLILKCHDTEDDEQEVEMLSAFAVWLLVLMNVL